MNGNLQDLQGYLVSLNKLRLIKISLRILAHPTMNECTTPTSTMRLVWPYLAIYSRIKAWPKLLCSTLGPVNSKKKLWSHKNS